MTVIVNPMAGGGRAGGAWRSLRDHLEPLVGELRVERTEAPGHAVHLARESGASLVVAVGGDGTVREVAQGLWQSGDRAETRPILGIVPAGRGSDLARALAPRRDWASMARVLLEPPARRVDLVRVDCADAPDTKIFANAAGAGFEAEVLRRANRRFARLPGTLGYVAALLASLRRFENLPVRIEIDGEAIDLRANTIVVANSEYFGGGMRVAPGASPADGLLDVVIVDDLSRRQLLATFPRIYGGSHVSSPHVSRAASAADSDRIRTAPAPGDRRRRDRIDAGHVPSPPGRAARGGLTRAARR